MISSGEGRISRETTCSAAVPRSALTLSRHMRRLLLLAILGLMWFFSSQADEVPTNTIEVEVNAPANAS